MEAALANASITTFIYIHHSPFIQIVIGDGGRGSNEDDSRVLPRYFIHFLTLDCSAFLGEEKFISKIWTGADAIPKGFASITLEIKANRQFLSPQMKIKLNPLVIKLNKVSRLPGVYAEPGSKTCEKYNLKNDKFNLLKQHTKKLYACCTLFDSLGMPRYICTDTYAHGSNSVTFHTSTTILASAFDRDTLMTSLETEPLLVELHDRDTIDSNDAENTFLLSLEERVLVKREEVKVDKNTTVEVTTPANLGELDVALMDYFNNKIRNAGNDNAHGVAQFSLGELLSKAADLREGFHAATISKHKDTDVHDYNPYNTIEVTLNEAVIPSKRRIIPKGGVYTYDLTEAQMIVRQPGAYIINDTRLVLQASLCRSLNTETSHEIATSKPKLSRIVYSFDYGYTDVLQMILSAIQYVNAAALPGVSLRSYQLTDDERHRAEVYTITYVHYFVIIHLLIYFVSSLGI